MNDNGIIFNQHAKNIAFNDEHYKMMMTHYDLFRQIIKNSAEYYSDLNLEKLRAYNIKNKAFKNLDKLLVDFDTNFTNNGGKVLWARTADEAKQLIYNILNKEKVKKIVKTNSSTSEEIGLTSYLKMKKIKVIDTNIGDFICHLNNERPYNIRSTAFHQTLKEVADLYTEKFGIKENCNPKQLTTCTKKILNDSFFDTGAVITGANFLISDTGSIVLTEDEGNILKSITYTPIHIIVAGIDKLISSIDESNVLLPLSSLYETNKNISTYYTFINKPFTDGDKIQKLYVILLNNSRTEILAKKVQRSILFCIQCGACANVCPVYNTIGGHIYEESRPGPVSSIIAPIVKGMEKAAHFCSLCTLCGQCTEVCPVNIPIKDLFIENRKDLIKIDKSLISERFFLNHLMKKMSSRKNLDKHGNSFKNFELKRLIKKKWGSKREFPEFAAKSFSQYWKEINQIEG